MPRYEDKYLSLGDKWDANLNETIRPDILRQEAPSVPRDVMSRCMLYRRLREAQAMVSVQNSTVRDSEIEVQM